MKKSRLSLLVGAALLLAGCGGGGGETAAHPILPEKVRDLKVTLDGYESPENVGLLLAERGGYFFEAGLNVNFASPATPMRPVEYVVDGTDEIGISHEPQLVLAKEKGAPIVAVGTLLSAPTAALVWTEHSHIRGIADLRGKTIAIPGLSFQRALLQSVLARGGLTLEDVTVKTVGYDLVPSLVSGRADATFGGSWNIEGPELEARGLKPVVKRVQSLGVPGYGELVVIARADLVAEKPGVIRDFMAAVARGDAAAIEDPGSAVEAIDFATDPGPESSHALSKAEVERTVPLLSKSGQMNPARVGQLVDWMDEQGLIQRRPPLPTLLTNVLR
jgi:putative hydroxymethylpyrimidine transport system substrate-binding protein